MSTDQTQENDGNGNEQMPDEMTMLKQRATMMGIPFSNNIGIETLRQKIADKMSSTSNPPSDDISEIPSTDVPSLNDPANPTPKKETLRQRLTRENMRLVRLRITNMDPKKKDLPGEIFTVANNFLGTVSKFIPYGEITEDGYHVPYILYKNLKTRKFLNIRTFKDKKNGNVIKVEQNWALEFALEVLPPLTKDELARLGTAQLAAGGLS